MYIYFFQTLPRVCKMNTLSPDCLCEALSYFCVHEVKQFCAVNKRWRRMCCLVKSRLGCVYKHHVIKGSAEKYTCCFAHTIPDGSMFVEKYNHLVADLDRSSGPSFPRRGCWGVFIHFETSEERKRFLCFVKERLGMNMALGGTCCSGNGQKVHGIWRRAE